MKMNGLDSKHYWINYFIVSFLLCMLTSFNMYIFGAYINDNCLLLTDFTHAYLGHLYWMGHCTNCID